MAWRRALATRTYRKPDDSEEESEEDDSSQESDEESSDEGLVDFHDTGKLLYLDVITTLSSRSTKVHAFATKPLISAASIIV